MKPDWKEAPIWANWLTRDEAGLWVWHEYRPDVVEFGWYSIGQMDTWHYSEHWRDSLEAHPNAGVHAS